MLPLILQSTEQRSQQLSSYELYEVKYVWLFAQNNLWQFVFKETYFCFWFIRFTVLSCVMKHAGLFCVVQTDFTLCIHSSQ